MFSIDVLEITNEQQVRDTLETICLKVPKFRAVDTSYVMSHLKQSVGLNIMMDTKLRYMFRFLFIPSSRFSENIILAIEVKSADNYHKIIKFMYPLPNNMDYIEIEKVLKLMSRKHPNIDASGNVLNDGRFWRTVSKKHC